MNLLFKKIKYNPILIPAICIITIIFYCTIQNNWIYIDHINVSLNNLPPKLKGLKIAHISDVHLPKNAASIDTIIKKVKNEKPDIIVMTGDIIDASADIKSCGLDTLSYGLSQIAPTYAVTGNHEFNNGNIATWKSILNKCNISVVDNSVEIFKKNNESIAIMGLEDGGTYNPELFKQVTTLGNIPKILLVHRPEFIGSYFSNGFDIIPNLVFSGHAHGGQFRIPLFNKGVIAPGQGILPRYTSGLYKFDDGQLIISRGLGNSIIPIRINNRPHIPIVTLN